MQSMQKEFMLYVIDFKFHFLKWMRNLCKRGYENVVGLSFVRDLYGMVMNEGTTKGILVTMIAISKLNLI